VNSPFPLATAAQVSAASKQLFRGNTGFSVLQQIFRPYIAPFETLLPRVPQAAAVLDVGCGAGLFLGLLAKSGRISRGVGFDTSRAAIALAQRMTANLPRPSLLEFKQVDATGAWPEGEFDVVSLIDVLHHVAPRFQLSVLSQALASVRAGGIILYKDMGTFSRWRAVCNQAHDLILARQWIHYVPMSQVRDHLLSSGMTQVEHGRVVRYWYAHEWSVFKRASDA